MGGFNNVIKVDQSDLEVFKALDADNAAQKLHIRVEILSDDKYGQRIPDLNLSAHAARGPPILPPQLGSNFRKSR